MSDELNVKISKIKAGFLKELAQAADVLGNNDKKISKEEAAKLADALNGKLQDAKNKKKFEKESDEVKEIFGFTSTIAASTEAKVEKDAPAAPVVKAKEAEDSEAPDILAYFNGLDAEHKEIMDAYKKARGFDPENGGRANIFKVPEKTVKAAYDEVEAQFKKDKKYKQALKDLEDYAKHIDAHFVAKKAIRDSESTTSKEVKADAEKALAERNNGKMDKWEKHALHNTDRKITKRFLGWASGRNSEIKELRKAAAAGNRADEVKENKFTAEQITDALGKKSPLTVDVLEKAGLITKTNDGYDIKILSEAVSRAIGADNTANREQHKGESELERTKDELRRRGVDVGKISDKEIKKVIKFCGYRVQKKNYASTVYDTVIGGALAGAATATAVATNPYNRVVHNLHVEQNVEVPINLGGEQFVQDFMREAETNYELQAVLAETGGSITFSGAEILIKISQLYDTTQIVTFSKHLLSTSMKGALVGAGLGLLKGLTDYGPSEKGLFDTTLDCTTYEGLSRVIDGRVADGILTREQGLALKLLATEFIQTEKGTNGVDKAITTKTDNGNCEIVIDCQGFMKKLRDAAGNSKLNTVELDAVAKNYENPFEVKRMEKESCDKPVVETKPIVEQKKQTEEKVQEKFYDSDYKEVPRTEKFEAWADFATRYDCLEGDFNPKFDLRFDPKTKKFNPNSYARTMMKVMQAVTNDDYDLDRLKKLTDAAEKGDFKTLKAEKDFDYNLYRALRGNKETHTFAYDRQKMPTITMKDGQNQIISCEPRKEAQYKASLEAGGTGRKTTINGQEGSGFVRTDDGEIDVKVTTAKAYNSAVQKANDAGYIPKKK